MRSGLLGAIACGTGGSQRPSPTPHAPIAPPFDPSDSSGDVHTTLPPEQVIPDHFADPTWLRADFNGVTLDLDRWNPNAPQPLPFLRGANSTPLAMLMTPMLIAYPRYWQDACLTEHAERGYDDFIVECDGDGWNLAANGVDTSPAAILAWVRYLRSWGFRPVLWRGNPPFGSPIDPMFDTLVQAGVLSFYIHGEEVDRKLSGPAYEASVQAVDAYLGGRIPFAAHFTADGDRHMGYPIGAPRDDFLRNWSLYDGRLHLCEQLDVTASAGLQGASMYYARQHVNAGLGDAALGPGAPHSRVIAFETMASAQFQGACTEGTGNLRDWELLCGTRTDPRVRPVSGFGNGARSPDGRPI